MGRNTDLITGAVIGGVLGGVIGLLFAPKSGSELREDIAEGYTAINNKSQEITRDLKKKGAQLYHQCERLCSQGECNACDEEECSCDQESTGTHVNTLMIGGAIGAVIGATAALLLAPQSGEKLRSQLGDSYEDIRDKAEDFVSTLNSKRKKVAHDMEDWKETFSTIVEKLSSPEGRRKASSRVNEIADWASLGLRLFKQLQNR